MSSTSEVERLPYDASTEAEVFQYFQTRALQLAPYGYIWNRKLTPITGGFTTQFNLLEATFDSFYIVAQHRNTGHAVRAVKKFTNPVLTVFDCGIVDFLDRLVPYHCQSIAADQVEYQLIETFYGTRCAKRSGVYLMNHIDEGLYILSKIDASDEAKRAFCLHPLLQADDDLVVNFDNVVERCTEQCNGRSIALAMEYRNIANRWLSDKVYYYEVARFTDELVTNGVPDLSRLHEVNDMLIADKIQNYKDFILYHKGTHPRSDALELYFKTWLKALAIDNFDQWFEQLCNISPKRT